MLKALLSCIYIGILRNAAVSALFKCAIPCARKSCSSLLLVQAASARDFQVSFPTYFNVLGDVLDAADGPGPAPVSTSKMYIYGSRGRTL